MNTQIEQKDALIEKLIACTKSNNYKIRAAAYTALGNFTDNKNALCKIIEGLNDSNSQVRDAARESVNKVYNEQKEQEFFKIWLCNIEELRKIS